MTLTPDHDPMGQAIADYAAHGQARRPLMVTSYMFDDDEMPVATLFRTEASMPRIELEALRRCRGRVLDVGAGAGCHTLALEARGLQVTSIDISPLSTQVRTERGAHDARCADFFADDFGRRFDTVLLLMNGLGMAGTLAGLPALLHRCRELLAEGGRILADSSDLRYVFEDDNGQLQWDDADGYYGEVDYLMTYGTCRGERFDWLYVDFPRLQAIAAACGMRAEMVAEGDHYDYLAEITADGRS